jgi:hypothetical protein
LNCPLLSHQHHPLHLWSHHHLSRPPKMAKAFYVLVAPWRHLLKHAQSLRLEVPFLVGPFCDKLLEVVSISYQVQVKIIDQWIAEVDPSFLISTLQVLIWAYLFQLS